MGEPAAAEANSTMTTTPPLLFDGSTLDPSRDSDRLKRQLDSVYACMADGLWHTLEDISVTLDCPEASVSARLRDLRKPRFGAHRVERRYVRRGLFEYRLAP